MRFLTLLFSSALVVRSSISLNISRIRSLVSVIVAAWVWSIRVAPFKVLFDKNLSSSSSTSTCYIHSNKCNIYIVLCEYIII